MVKKVSLIIKLLIFAINLHGQQENAERCRIGLRFSPDLCYRTLSNNTSKDSVNAIVSTPFSELGINWNSKLLKFF